jgi:hypothetical protein
MVSLKRGKCSALQSAGIADAPRSNGMKPALGDRLICCSAVNF